MTLPSELENDVSPVPIPLCPPDYLSPLHSRWPPWASQDPGIRPRSLADLLNHHPRRPRLTLPLTRSWFWISMATSMGIAKDSPCNHHRCVNLGIDPDDLSLEIETGRRNCPDCATSVWMKEHSSLRQGTPLAETMPAVTELSKPNGEPMATTHSPTRLAGSPRRTVGNPAASMRISDIRSACRQ